MDCSPAEFDVNVVCPEDQGKVPAWWIWVAWALRDPRGVRYRLVHILVFVLLGKLAGEDRLTGIADTARKRWPKPAPPGAASRLTAGSWAQRRLRRCGRWGNSWPRTGPMDSWFRRRQNLAGHRGGADPGHASDGRTFLAKE